MHALGLLTAPGGAAAASCPRGGFRWFAPGRAPHERGSLSVMALLRLVAVAGYQSRDRIAEGPGAPARDAAPPSQ
ncbi:hypothetical protein GCM10007890_11270 [Methylobacterium tardum]|uniref:Uncharacterized protein n=1 Tax=Methylobacterium tardum TaxID=374432 RepID=A0AA37WPK1_9HYPH|nr:hypothetical protein GCM10007890_11270 [Methylobacterium tardum]